MGSSAIQLGQALSGAALPLAYGPVRARGNQIINTQLADNSRVAFYILGEGVWDGIDRLWINAKLVNIADTTLVHFHNGFDGTLGAGLAPSSNGGDQLVDNFWSLLPSNLQPATFSRKAYLVVHVQPDPKAPSSTLDVIGDYRTMRVRTFDASGNQTGFVYSTNPAWMILDIKLRQLANREWTSAGALAGDLTAAQKARFDWTAWADSAAWCDTVLANGAKRFECGLAFANTAGMQQALDQLCTLSQTYLIDEWGQIGLWPDEPRVSTFVMSSDHITPGSLQPLKTQLRSATNRFIGTFNDLNAQNSCNIDSVANTGLSRTSNVVTVKVPAGTTHPFLVNDNVDIVNPTDASFAGTITVTVVVDSRTFKGNQTGANATSGGGYCGTTESRFAQRTFTLDHENHQLAVGQVGVGVPATHKRVPVTIDLGNNTMERAQRILAFISARSLGADVSPYKSPFTLKLQASAYAVDAFGAVLAAQYNGDVITLDSTVSEEFQGDWEILNKKLTRPATDASNSGSQPQSGDQSSQAAVLDITLKQYLPGAFGDASDSAQALAASMIRLGLNPVETVDGSGNLIVSMARTIDDAGTARFAVSQVDTSRLAIIDYANAQLNKDARDYGQNVLENPSFEVAPAAGSGDVAAGWYVQSVTQPGLFTVSRETNASGSAFVASGNNVIKVSVQPNQSVPAGTTQQAAVQSRAQFPVSSGQTWRGIAKIRVDQNVAVTAGLQVNADIFIRVLFSDATVQDFPSTLIGTASLGTGFIDLPVTFTVPTVAGKSVVSISSWMLVQVGNPTGGAISTPNGLMWDVRYDCLALVRQTTDGEAAFNASTHINGQGSLSGAADVTKFSYSSTSTSITPSWLAQSAPRPDGSSIAVSAGSQSAFTGLTAATMYHFGIYIDQAGLPHVVMSDNTTSKGSIAWQVQTIAGDGHIVVTMDWTASTPSSGTGGGAGGGSGETCPADDEPMETRELGVVPAVNVNRAMFVRSGDGDWIEVEEAFSVEGWLQWVQFDYGQHHVDADHKWLRPEGNFRAPLDSDHDWISQRDLHVGDYVKGSDEALHKVLWIGDPHRGRYRKIRVKPRPNGDRSMRMGKGVTHNFNTI